MTREGGADVSDVELFSGTRHFRQRSEGQEQKSTTLELFFDLVFVFAITQLSHSLLQHLTVTGAAKTLFLLLVVWWAWTYTTWMTNFMDPDSIAVRVVLMATMLASLLMAIAIPGAFGDRAPLFALTYAGLQIGRNLFVVHASPAGSAIRSTFTGLLVWSLASGAFYVAGGFAAGAPRVALWLIALAIDVAGPATRYWVPGLRRVMTDDWEIDSGHFSERFQLFIIIALGESIVITGATASNLQIDLARAIAIAVAFLGSAALWWLYFSYVADIATRRLENADDRGRLARDAYTYLHLPIVAGIIVTAVGDEIVIAHPGSDLHGAQLVALAGGPALYLVGHLVFRLRMARSTSRKRLSAVLAIAMCGVLGSALPALAVAVLIAAVLVVLIAAETVAGQRRRAAQSASAHP
jgi:low temperature requirement protein LtrA